MKKQNRHTLTSIIFILVWLTLTSCQDNSEIIVPQFLKEKQIPSLTETYPEIYSQAKRWDDNAKLSLVDISIGTKRNDIAAFYEHVDDLSEGLMVRYEADGTITTKIIEYNFPRTKTRKRRYVDISEIEIDSVDAWDIFLTRSEILSYKQKSFECTGLILLPTVFEGIERNIWRLSVGECEAHTHDYFHIDARTGEWLEIDFP